MGAKIGTGNVAFRLGSATPSKVCLGGTVVWPTDPSFSSVALLLHMDGPNGSTAFTDSSGNAHAVVANGGAQISTAQSKFGGSSADFDAVDSYLSVADDASLHLGATWTLEWWMYARSLNAPRGIVSKGIIGDVFNGAWSLEPSGSVLTFYADMGGGASPVASTAGAVALNQWVHMAIVSNAGVVTVYVNGEGGTPSGSVSIAADGGGDLFVGGGFFAPASRCFDGYIDEFRFTSGVARYTANFTPPAAAFPNQ